MDHMLKKMYKMFKASNLLKAIKFDLFIIGSHETRGNMFWRNQDNTYDHMFSKKLCFPIEIKNWTW